MIKKMAALLTAGTLLLSACGTDAGQTGSTPQGNSSVTETGAEYQSLFEEGSLLDIQIEIAQEDWDSILADPTAEEYHSASVTIGGQTLENVGFRTKGNLTLSTTARSDSDRYSFRVKFDKYVDGQTYDGLDEMVLNSGLFDPSFMREYLTYEAFRQLGQEVPGTAFANVYINGELFGFYLAVEAVDDSYLERVFGNNDGNLYKADRGSTLQDESSVDILEQKNGKDETKSDLKTLISTLNEMPDGEKGDIESILDVDSVLKYIAVNTVLANEDSYVGSNAHNYYLYANGGVFSMIPWDYNMSFGGGMNTGNIGGQGGMGAGPGEGGQNMPQGDGVPPDMPQPDTAQAAPDAAQDTNPADAQGNDGARGNRPQGGPGGRGGMGGGARISVSSSVTDLETLENRPLVSKLLAVPEYRERYLGYVSALADYLESLKAGVPALADTIREYVEADPTKFYTMEEFEAQISESESSGLMGFISQRLENIRSQLENQIP